MGNFLILLIISLISVNLCSSNSINNNLDLFSFNKISNNSNYSNEKLKTNNNKNLRKLESGDDSFKNIRIFIDTTYINQQNSVSSEILNKVISSMEKCIKSVEDIIKVNQSDKIILKNSDIQKLGFTNNEINQKLLPDNEGILADLIIFPKFEEFQSKSQLSLAIGKPIIFDSLTNRPIV